MAWESTANAGIEHIVLCVLFTFYSAVSMVLSAVNGFWSRSLSLAFKLDSIFEINCPSKKDTLNENKLFESEYKWNTQLNTLLSLGEIDLFNACTVHTVIMQLSVVLSRLLLIITNAFQLYYIYIEPFVSFLTFGEMIQVPMEL